VQMNFRQLFMGMSFWSMSAVTCLAVTLPSRMPAFVKNSEAIDPGLEAWIKTHAAIKPLSELTSQEVLQRVADKDAVTRALILLEYDERRTARGRASNKSKTKYDKELDETIAKLRGRLPELISKELEKSSSDNLYLLQHLFMTWRDIDKDSAEKSELGSKIFQSGQTLNCATKNWSLESVSKEKVSKMTSEEIVAAIKVASSYQSTVHRRRYLESLASVIPEEKRGEASATLRPLVQDIPTMFQRFPWLQDKESKDLPQSLIFADAMRAVRRKQCREAETAFERLLKESKSKIQPETALDVGSDIDRCFRAERRMSSAEFWRRVSPLMQERFGTIGSLWVKVRLGYLKWAGNDTVESEKIFSDLLKSTSGSKEYRSIEAKAMYYLGKVAEDQNDLVLANKHLAEYVLKFPEEEDFEFAFNSLVVNFAAQKKWQEVITPIERYLAQQSLVHMDRRPVSVMAFSLFWLGRAKLETGHADMAMELWRRLAAEYYSTFYGAMGHYLLEQSSGNSYAIEPARTTGFDYEKIESTLSKQNKLASRLSISFLRLGLMQHARCEADEVVAGSTDEHDTLLARTMLLHASGSWLDAIKIYDSIPRSVRNGLPIGFERVLFPRKYDDLVKIRAAKLGVDPDFVFALMRQESVFAENALSPVGAMGLMQLMPSTARLELGKLSSDYINAAQRAELSQTLANQSALRDPEINVTLGVHHLWRLMQTYRSPVFALTAYNAGPAPTEKWQKAIATDDWLTFIERIPYKETRAYVKLILRNYFYYKRWYNHPDGKRQIHIDSVMDGVVDLAKSPPLAENN